MLSKEDKEMIKMLDLLQQKVDELDALIRQQRNNFYYGAENLEVIEGDLF